MLAIVLTFALLTTYVIAEIPSYIHVCGHRNPNINQCIADSVDNLRTKLCQGIPEMEVPPLEPLLLPKLILSETNNVKLYINEPQIMGLCGFVINNVYVDLDKLKMDFNILLGDIYVNSTYDFDIRILVAIISKGQLSFTADNVNADLYVDFKMVTKNGKKYLYLSKVTTNLDIKGFKTKFENSDQLREIFANLIGNNQKELLTTFTPALEEAVSKFIILTGNNILKHFTYEEMLPDRM